MPNLDFLRAVAVLLVLFSHLTQFAGFIHLGPLNLFWMGGVGVYFFFVHTCLVLMLSLQRQWQGQRSLQLFGSFMIRRIFRIYPLSIVTIALVLALRLPQGELHGGYFSPVPIDLRTLVSNLLLIQGNGHSIVSVMWTLPYEMAMYLFLPWLFLLLYPHRSLWLIAVIWAIAVVAAVAFLFSVGWAKKDYFLEYIPCFLPGVMAYQLQKTSRRQLPSFLWPVLVALIVPLFLYRQNVIPDFRLKSWCLCLAIGLSIPHFAQISWRWITVPAHLVAKYSYGIYLMHSLCMGLVFNRLHQFLPQIVRIGLFAMLVSASPVLLYHTLEEPMIALGKRVARRFEKRVARRRADSPGPLGSRS